MTIGLRRFFWLYAAACALCIAAILALMPAEKTLGQVIKIIYLHGALSRAGMLGFVAGGVAGLIYLLRADSKALAWSSALTRSGWVFWTMHFLVSMPATRLTWGPWIAWGEPRVTMTLQIIGVGLALIAISVLVAHPRFTGAVNVLLGSVILVLAAQTGVLRHPLDPIGSSPSVMLRVFYGLLLIPVMVGMLLMAWRLVQAGFVSGQATDPVEA